MQIHKYKNLIQKYTNTNRQIQGQKYKYTNKDKTRYPNSDLGPDFCDHAHCPTANSRQMLSKLHQSMMPRKSRLLGVPYKSQSDVVSTWKSLGVSKIWGLGCVWHTVSLQQVTARFLANPWNIVMLTPLPHFYNTNVDTPRFSQQKCWQQFYRRQPFTARVAVQSDGRGARGGSE